MKTRSIFRCLFLIYTALMFLGCNKVIPEPENEDFNVKAFISKIKSYDVIGEYIDNIIPADTTSSEKPFVSVQSWVIKGKDILMSITVPDDAEEIYFGAVNSRAEYMGLDFNGQLQEVAKGYYRLELKNVAKSGGKSKGSSNYLVVFSSNENTEVDKFDLIASFKTAAGISNIESVLIDVMKIAPYQKVLKAGFKPLTGYSYTIKITNSAGGQVSYSYNKGTGAETFNNEQIPDATLSYDPDLDINWIDFADPQFGGYTMTATIQIDLNSSSQTIFLLMAIVSEGKIDQLDLDADIQQTGQNTAVGTVDIGFSYFQEYQYRVVIEPILTDGIKRIPNSDTIINDKKIIIKVEPNQLPENEFITLELKTDPQTTGFAVFVEGNIEKQTLSINGTKTITIRGKVNSSKKENILLTANYKGSSLDSQRFSVRTWIKEMKFDGHFIDPLGILITVYKVISESGKIIDLFGLLIGEHVTYEKSPAEHIWKSPPYRDVYTSIKNPYIDSSIIGIQCLLSDNLFFDYHRLPTHDIEHPIKSTADVFKKDWLGNYKEDVSKCTQYYWFNDPVIDNQSIRRKIYGNNTITREVTKTSVGWKYKITKINAEGTVIPPYIIVLP